MHHSGALFDDSLTSITSVSSNSTVEDLEEVEEEEEESRRQSNMGQKNTHEETSGSKNAKSKHSKLTKAKGSSRRARGSPQANTNGDNAEDDFVEVLDSDEESDKPLNEENPNDAVIANVLYKFGLENDSLTSQGSSSDDNYDQPEGIEGISRQSKKKKALTNWHRVLSKVGNEVLPKNDEDNVDHGSVSRHGEYDYISHNEVESDYFNEDDDREGRAVRNWERLVSKLIGGRIQISLRDVLTENATTEETRSNSQYESPPRNQSYPRAIENWRKILSKVLELVAKGAGLRKLVKEIKKVESRGEIAFTNWKRIIEKVINKSRRESLAYMIKSGLVEKSDSNESDIKRDEGNIKRVIENWESITSKVIQKNAENDMRKLLQEVIESPSAKDNGNDINSSNSTDSDDQRPSFQNWKRIISKLIEKHQRIDMRTIFQKNKEGKDGLLTNDNEIGDSSATDSDTDNERAVRNWKILVSGMMKNNKINFINKLLKSTQKDRKTVKDGDENSNNGLSVHSEKWERLVTGTLKNARMRDLQGLMFTLNDSRSGSSTGNSDTTTTDSDADNERAIRNWTILVSGMIKNNKINFINELLKSKQTKRKTVKDGDENSDNELSIHSAKWERLVSGLLKKARIGDLQGLIFTAKGTRSGSSTGNSDTSSADGDIDNERAVRNWKVLVSEMIRNNKINFINELLKSMQKDRKMVKDGDGNSGNGLSIHSTKWERLVSGVLKNARIMGVQALMFTAKDTRSGPSSGDSDTSGLSSRQGSVKNSPAIHHWWSMAEKLIERDKETTFKQIIKVYHGKVQEEQRGTPGREGSTRAIENWEKVVHKMMIRQQVKASLIREVDEEEIVTTQHYDELQSEMPIDDETSGCTKQNEKQLRAMKNWKSLSSRVRVITNMEHDSDGKNIEGVCPSCKNDFLCPILLSCSHTFCRDCVTKFITDSGGECFKCQACGAKNVLSDDDEELFCPNFVILRQMQHAKSGDDGCKYCGRNKDAEFICAECADKYCKDCATRHTEQRIFKDHNLLDLQSAESEGDLRKRYYCLKHEKEELTNYCLTCEVSLCTKCAKKKHKGSKHDCGSVSAAASAGREILKDATKKLVEEDDFEPDLANVKKMQDGLDVELDEVTREIKRRIQNLIGKLRERETQLCDEVERKHEIIYDALSRRKDDIELAAQQVETFETLLPELQEHKNDVEMLQMQATVGDRMREIIQLKQENGMFIDYDFIFHPDEHAIESAIDKYGSIHVQDRESKRVIIVEGYEDVQEKREEPRIEEDILVTGGNSKLSEDSNKNIISEDEDYELPRETWSPTVRKREEPRVRKRAKSKAKYSSDSDDAKNGHNEQKGKKRQHTSPNKRATREELKESPKKQTSKIDRRDTYEEIEPQMYEFEGLRQPSYEGFTQLTSERGEQVNMLKYGVLNYKNESCEVNVKMVCPDKSIVSAHVAENADGAFTVFFCPKVKSDFNCFITMGGKCFKKEYKLLNFYGDFRGMKSKEIDLACRAMSLLRWHVTPGLLEKKRGKIKRSRKFMRIVGTKKVQQNQR